MGIRPGSYNAGYVLLEALILLFIFTLILGTVADLMLQLVKAEQRLRQQQREEEAQVSHSALLPFLPACGIPVQDRLDSG